MRLDKVSCHIVRIPRSGQDASGGKEGLNWGGRRHYLKSKNTDLYSDHLQACLIRVQSESGLVGWGEALSTVAPEIIATIVEKICKPVLLGAPDDRPVQNWNELYTLMRQRGHTGGFYIEALAGIEMALYDLLARTLEVPLFKLFGGQVRDSIPSYAGVAGKDKDETVAISERFVAEGASALKVHLRVPNDDIIDAMTAVRKAVGQDVRLMLDVHHTRSVGEAKALASALQALNLDWLEAPVSSEDVQGHAEVAAHSMIPIGLGEYMGTGYAWRPYLEARAIGVAMPDFSRTGLTEGRRVAQACELYNIPVSPHVGDTGIVSLAAAIQMSAALPNAFILEHFPAQFGQKSLICSQPPELNGDQFVIPDTPGLGIELDEDALKHFGDK